VAPDGELDRPEIAHLGPVELLTPRGEESLRFFVDETVHRFHTYGTPPVG
jgi:hypothetical protein